MNEVSVFQWLQWQSDWNMVEQIWKDALSRDIARLKKYVDENGWFENVFHSTGKYLKAYVDWESFSSSLLEIDNPYITTAIRIDIFTKYLQNNNQRLKEKKLIYFDTHLIQDLVLLILIWIFLWYLKM